jgi:hypothetical protein
MTSSVEAEMREVAKRSSASVKRGEAAEGESQDGGTRDIGFSGLRGRMAVFIDRTLLCCAALSQAHEPD